MREILRIHASRALSRPSIGHPTIPTPAQARLAAGSPSRRPPITSAVTAGARKPIKTKNIVSGTAAAAVLSLGFILLFVQEPGRAQSGDALTFFKNYFVTGDYMVGGVDLSGESVNGFGTGEIHFNQALGNKVPAKAEILAAFLYWEMITIGPPDLTGATFRGYDISAIAKPLGSNMLDKETSPCWSGGAGDAFEMTMFRADVVRFLHVPPPTINGGKTIVNDEDYAAAALADPSIVPLRVRLPEASGNHVPSSAGATLIVIFRDRAPTAPLRSIVIYDGIHAQKKDKVTKEIDVMQQMLEGFYQFDSAPPAKMTHVVGSGAKNDSERLFIGDLVNPISLNPFKGTASPSSDRAWDNPTFSFSIPSSASDVTTTVDHLSNSPYDCLAWPAIVVSGNAMDSDFDGLLDVWESSETSGTLSDPNGQPLPDLYGMGARPDHKDLFVEIGYMKTDDNTTYGGVPKPAHSHLPTPAALKMVGDAFNANGIKVHFDVGNNYQGGEAAPYIIPESFARGGEAIDETVTVCARDEDGNPRDDPPWVCQFSEYPGTVGWKSGFRFIKDMPLDPTLTDDQCDALEQDGDPNTNCERVFDRSRKDIFHYAFFAHALGVPKEACLLPDGFPDFSCQDTNPLYHVPATNTGVADFPGGDVLATLGAFDDAAGKPVGTPFMQASTLMHEWGHNFERKHGGDAGEPNCKPNYLSVMNYSFQLRGLPDDSGVPHLNYSGEVVESVDETLLTDGALGTLPYRTGWYAPQGPGTIGSAAKKFCNGLDFPDPLPDVWVPMVRTDATSVSAPIDWNADGESDSSFSQDVNFDGVLNGSVESTPPLQGSDDWSNLRLNQLGSRRNVGGWYFVPDTANPGAFVAYMGPLSLDVSRGDLGRGDLGRGDLGRGDLGRGDLGRGDLGVGGPDEPLGDMDFEIAAASGFAPPNELRACVIGEDARPECAVGPLQPLHRVRLDWKAPNVGSVSQYSVYRVVGPTVTPGSVTVLVGGDAVPGSQTILVDDEELPHGVEFTYFVVADFDDGTRSGPSNLKTITAVNDPPVANHDPGSGPAYVTFAGRPLVVGGPGVLANDALSEDSAPPTELRAVELLAFRTSNGMVTLNADGSFTYTPNPGFVGTDTFQYQAYDWAPNWPPTGRRLSENSAPATVTITVEGYGFIGVLNLPPPLRKTFNAGSSVPLKWQFTIGGVAVDSRLADPLISIINAEGKLVYEGDPEDPGKSSFRFPTGANGWTWQFNWQTVDSSSKALAGGVYSVTITSQQTGQTFGPFFMGLK